MVLTMQADHTGGTSGFAYCTQTDQFNRCTVGFLNINPTYVDAENGASPNVVQDARKIVLHEILHLLGCCDPSPSPSLSRLPAREMSL